MAISFDKRVQTAVEKLWVTMDYDNGDEARRALLDAAHDGDGDAHYFLGRCYAGPCFVSPRFGFQEDVVLAERHFDKSLELGSAVGMFATMRLAGYKPKSGSFVNPPYHSLKEVWDTVESMANSGEIFCQYLIANAYYFGDAAKFLNINPTTVPDVREAMQIEHEWTKKAIVLHENCLKRGMLMGLGNLIDIFKSGDAGIPKQPERVKELIHFGARMGNGFYENKVGQEYAENKQPEKAAEYFHRAVSHGEFGALFHLGLLYTFGGDLPRDLPKAKKFFEESLAHDEYTTGCHNRLGEIYFYGGDGIEPDYTQAYPHLLAAFDWKDCTWGSDMLGTCYLKGLGTEIDYKKAKKLFEIYPSEPLSAIGLGEIYAYGLGVSADINYGMGFWDQFPNDPRVIENKKNFKRVFFFFWKRVK